MTDRTTEEARKAFIAVANDRGYDTANAYDTERSRWVFFNPMTADLWAFWQAALQWQAEQQKGDDGRGLEACVTCGQPAASPHGVPTVTDAMVDAYLKANDAYWQRTDQLPTPPNKWRTGTPREATRESLAAALSSLPQAPQGEQG